MITLEKLTQELNLNQIDEVVAGFWSSTTAGGSSGGNDHLTFTISTRLVDIDVDLHFSFT